MFLHKVVAEKDDKMENLISCLAENLSATELIKIHQKMKEPWGLEESLIGSRQASQDTVQAPYKVPFKKTTSR